MASAFRWICVASAIAALAGMNLILARSLSLLPLGTLILSALSVVYSIVLWALPLVLGRSHGERGWRRTIAATVVWFVMFLWNSMAGVVAIHVVANWSMDPSSTTLAPETLAGSLKDTLLSLMGLITVVVASLIPYILCSERTLDTADLDGGDAEVRSKGDYALPAVWDDDFVRTSEQPFEPSPLPRHIRYHQQRSARSRRPSGAAAHEVLEFLLALPERTVRDGLDKRGAQIDCTQSALARETGYSKSTINAAIHKLDSDGLLIVDTWARCTRITLRHDVALGGEMREAA